MKREDEHLWELGEFVQLLGRQTVVLLEERDVAEHLSQVHHLKN